MPATLSYDQYGEGIGNAWAVLRDNAARAGLDAAVPTCPGWTVRHLVAHQGMVHRWAAGALRGARDDDACAEIEREGLDSPDILSWLDEGAKDLLSALAFAPEDLDVKFWLRDAPDARVGWARRQCHETTIHAVDAMAAAFGRPPAVDETWISPALGADGVDELLLGFLPRRKKLDFDGPRTVAVSATDTSQSWTLWTGDGPVRAEAGKQNAYDSAVTEVTGTAGELYLGLWNRGELPVNDPGFASMWQRLVQVLWA
jgi:uncharacterized protein (TIGR03083 family)